MAADDDLVLASSDNGIDEAELADGAGERVQLGVGDASGVGGIGPQVVDRDVDDGESVCKLIHQVRSLYRCASRTLIQL